MTRAHIELAIDAELTLAETGHHNEHVYAYWMWQEGRLPVRA